MIFSKEQMKQINLGLEKGVNINIYKRIEHDDLQVEQLRLGLESELNVNIYTDPKYSAEEMDKMRKEKSLPIKMWLLHLTPIRLNF